MPPYTVLKRRHTMIGKNLLKKKKKVKSHNPREKIVLARVKSNIPLEDMSAEDLCAKFRELTKENEKDILEMAGVKDPSINNLRLLMHYTILGANEMGQPAGQLLQDDVSILF